MVDGRVRESRPGLQAIRYFFSSEALVGKARRHTGSSLEWIHSKLVGGGGGVSQGDV